MEYRILGPSRLAEEALIDRQLYDQTFETMKELTTPLEAVASGESPLGSERSEALPAKQLSSRLLVGMWRGPAYCLF